MVIDEYVFELENLIGNRLISTQIVNQLIGFGIGNKFVWIGNQLIDNGIVSWDSDCLHSISLGGIQNVNWLISYLTVNQLIGIQYGNW